MKRVEELYKKMQKTNDRIRSFENEIKSRLSEYNDYELHEGLTLKQDGLSILVDDNSKYHKDNDVPLVNIHFGPTTNKGFNAEYLDIGVWCVDFKHFYVRNVTGKTREIIGGNPIGYGILKGDNLFGIDKTERLAEYVAGYLAVIKLELSKLEEQND